VSQEEDQVRWQDAKVLALYKLQDRVYLHTGGEEAKPAKRVCIGLDLIDLISNAWFSAKYIEGLENRLGRMESLLKLSGLLSEEDGGRTDLGTLEKRLADKEKAQAATNNGADSSKGSNRSSSVNNTNTVTDTNQTTPLQETHSSPRSSVASPETQEEEEKKEGVEELSDMMCSLVTNNCGETRYIGTPYLIEH